MAGLAETSARRIIISFGSYTKQLFVIVLSSSFILGLILAISLLVIGETSMNVNADLEFGGIDGLWLVIAVPLVSILVSVLLSPFSFLVHKLLTKKRAERVLSDVQM